MSVSQCFNSGLGQNSETINCECAILVTIVTILILEIYRDKIVNRIIFELTQFNTVIVR